MDPLPPLNVPHKPELSNAERNAIVQALLQRCNGEFVLERGAVNSVANEFNVNRNTIGRIWKRGIESMNNGNVSMDVSSKKKDCGRKAKSFENELRNYPTIPLNQRGTLRSAAAASEIPKTSLYRRLKSGEIRAHTNTVKPTLTEANMQRRVEFCTSHIHLNRERFQDMMDVVHMDEKWFYLCQNKRTYYLLDGEEEPHTFNR